MSVVVIINVVPGIWNDSQMRVTFMDEDRLHEKMRYVLRSANEQEGVGLALSHRFVGRQSVDFNLLKTWVEHCRSAHTESCSYRDILSGQSYPDDDAFRLIDCATRRIIHSKIMDVSFIALSYVWGPPLDNDSHHDPECLPETLPATIEDAINATIQLGFQYLWVDKYCINQKDTQDVKNQVFMMDIIYQAASVTIIAAAGAASTFGLPGMSRPRAVPSAFHLDGSVWVATRSDQKHPIKQSPWFGRGWT